MEVFVAVLYRYLPEGTKENHGKPVRITSIPANIRTDQVLIKNPQRTAILTCSPKEHRNMKQDFTFAVRDMKEP